MPSILVTLFNHVTIPANGNAIGPAGGLDLTGFNDFRLVLRLSGPAGTKFVINELYGPAGGVAQLNVDIDSAALNSLGSLNYRGKFDIFGPKSFFIRVFNRGTGPISIDGSLYAAE